MLLSGGRSKKRWGERESVLVLKVAVINEREIRGWEMQQLLSAMQLCRDGTTVLVSLSEASLLVECGGGKCLEKLFGSEVSCTLFQINVTCLLRNYCRCRVTREQECASRRPVRRKLQKLPKLW